MFDNSDLKQVIFDLDGTLTDPGLGIIRCTLHAMQSLGRPDPTMDQLRACVGPPLRDNFISLLGTDDPVLIENAVEVYRERTASHGIYENEVYPGVEVMLTTLRDAGFGLLIATSRPEVFAGAILRNFKLDHFFSARYCAQLDGSLSEKADLIGLLLQTEGLVANNCVMIGDRKHDVIGAKKNGMRAIGVTYGYGSVKELTEAGADHLCGNTDEITAFLMNSG
ncbi:MAG: HAD hydrolase-like protein [Pyrinomonadaceae bacterium]